MKAKFGITPKITDGTSIQVEPTTPGEEQILRELFANIEQCCVNTGPIDSPIKRGETKTAYYFFPKQRGESGVGSGSQSGAQNASGGQGQGQNQGQGHARDNRR